MSPYDHKKIEKKWQIYWEKKKLNIAKDGDKRPKFYGLIEFPFPSGDGLHVGHIRSNTAMDIIARKRRAEGFNVLYPIGWDAFGLPTENYAIKKNVHPKIVTKKNTDTFRRQLKAGGFSFDWSREVNTTDPKYYKWTQWIFLQLLKNDLAYKKKMAVNWCPKDLIGLANEEVINGCCERCGTPVEKREREQWMLAITKYADRLDRDLDGVNFLEKVKVQQRNWIGRSEGAEIDFLLDFKKTPEANKNRGPKGERAAIKVFTTRPDTIYGATYLVLSPEHPWVTLAADDQHDVLENKSEVRSYIEAAKKKSEMDRIDATKEKTGVELKGVKAINPASGEEIPMFVADYVLAGYGTGAIMAVPAHDERDHEFAVKFKLPIRRVIEPKFFASKEIVQKEFGIAGDDVVRADLPFVKREAVCAVVRNPKDDTYLCIQWKGIRMNGLVTGGIESGEDPIETAKREVEEETGYKNIKLVRDPEVKINTFFYHRVKQQNRWAHFTILFFDLVDEERSNISEEESKLHSVMWKKKSELKDFFTVFEGKFIADLIDQRNFVWTEKGILANSGPFNGKDSEEAGKEIVKKVRGKMVTTFKLRDWVFSRQRYWGEPIPVVHCASCGIVPVPERELPVELPNLKDFKPTESGESPLAKAEKWIKVKCPACKEWARRETDVMPNWAGSSWYYLRYVDPKNGKMLADKKKLKYWTDKNSAGPVDWYNGGMEHTTLHVLYSRFWHKFLFDIGVVPTSEPYMKRTSHGLILAEGGVKMSKSKGNVINPDDIIKAYGADTLRVYEMFMGPFDQPVAWSTESIIGSRRFIERIWRLREKVAAPMKKPAKGAPAPTENRQLISLIQKTIIKVSEDIEAMRFNTAISALMILLNEFERQEIIAAGEYGTFLQLVAPFAPHVADELWSSLGNKTSIHVQHWPVADFKKILDEMIRIGIQVGGKVRAELEVSAGEEEANIVKKALGLAEIQKWVEGKKIVKTVFVKGRLVNFVVA